MDRLQSMKVFQKVVEEGSFAAAARALDLSPAVVTRLVADLEEHLGTRLLHRSTRSLSLSAAGESYLERLRGILADIEDAEDHVACHTRAVAGTLRLACPAALAVYLVAPLVAEFRARHPLVLLDIDVYNDAPPPVEAHDITLLTALGAFDAQVIARKLLDSEAVLVASPAYLKSAPPLAVPQDLRAHANLRLRSPAGRTSLLRLERPDPSADGVEVVEVPVRPVLWCNHVDTLLAAVLGGAGVGSAAREMAAPYLAEGRLQRVLAPWKVGQLSVYAALPSRKFMPLRTKAFLDHLSQQRDWLLERAQAPVDESTPR
ncbi:LysR family transcriptional regulator [Ideonella livida]|uniref:LysR family transcriptional regulator n=1 Tax=Ideonella livida TaxID=2707176 RepID=A0A7C9TH45_9BURK|nr:LysR family transcriptional regulator [Ideonella livida]NDY90138.1 LysR family transcriptional regulator [Ideonella livida]